MTTIRAILKLNFTNSKTYNNINFQQNNLQKPKTMSGIKFDFGYKDNKYSKEKFEKINLTLLPLGYNYDDLFNQILPKVVGWYISSPNFDRETEEKEKKTVLSNFFFRPIFDSQLKSEMDGNSFFVKGDIELKKDNWGNDVSCVMVKDFYLCPDNEKEYFEVERYCQSYYKNMLTESQVPKNSNILNFELLESVPTLTDKKKVSAFVKKWRDYMEFEKGMFLKRMSYREVANYKIITIFELPNISTNKDDFKKDIYHEDKDLLYIKSTVENSDSKFTTKKVIECTIEESVKDGADSDMIKKRTKEFAKNDLSIISGKDITLFEEMKKGTTDKELKELALGDLLKYESTTVNEKGKITKVKSTIARFFKNADGVFLEEDIYEQKIKADFGNNIVLADIASGDMALYKRGTQALDDIIKGNVKNPWLAGYLIEPEKFERYSEIFDENNVEFIMKNLNKNQKDSIIKCLNSNNIFLLQGPPGTGKTQTITELVYQYNKMGKKVIISSQTHIAIDNVIDRLPKDLNILPMRLVTEKRNTKEEFLPDKLVDMLYNAATEKYQLKMNNFNNYAKKIASNEKEFEHIEFLCKQLKDDRIKLQNFDYRINGNIQKIMKLSNDISVIEAKIIPVENKIKIHELFYDNSLEMKRYDDDLIDTDLEDLLKVFANKYGINVNNCKTVTCILYEFSKIAGKAQKEKLLTSSSQIGKKPKELVELEQKIFNLKKELAELALEDSDEATEKMKTPRTNINKLNQEKKILDEKYSNKSFEINEIGLFFTKDSVTEINPEILEIEVKEIEKFSNAYLKLISNFLNKERFNQLGKELLELQSKGKEFDLEMKRLQISDKKMREEKESVKAPIAENQKLIEAYFNDFFINKQKLDDNSIPESDQDKLEKIRVFIDQEKQKFEENKKSYKQLHPIYQSILSHLQNDEIKSDMIEHRKSYTKSLFDNNANVFGITCTSAPVYYQNKNEYLNELGLGDFKISRKDFDVVIIDEVSKATPIEMLIPILYGKTVVLVGDHRQLPPIFKYRESSFESFTASEKQDLLKGRNLNEYKDMVETSLFEQMYKALKTNKDMLTAQYRSHEKIMDIVNVFYDGKLKLGDGKDQNNRKQHNLEVSSASESRVTPIIAKDKYTYWFNSYKDKNGRICFDSQGERNTTSKYNELELKITIELVKKIDEAYGLLKKSNEEEYRKSIGDSDNDKPSLGIISLYGEHAGKLWKELKRNGLNKPKYITIDNATVDNYQGKENDIIIVNLVSNNQKKDAGEFSKKFNRINVAVSRARNLLIIVGATEFWCDQTVNVPTIETNTNRNMKAYQEIYNRCEIKFNSTANILNII